MGATEIDRKKVDEVVESYGGGSSWLVMGLQDIQDCYNYLPAPVLRHVAKRFGVGLSQVYNVATFYSSLSLTERGKHVIKLCDGTACHLRGAVNLREEVTRQLGIEHGQTTDDKMFTLEVVACLGACALAPVMTIGSQYHGQMTLDKVRQTLDEYRSQSSGKTHASSA